MRAALEKVVVYSQMGIDNDVEFGVDASDHIRVREIARAALAPAAMEEEVKTT